MATVRALSYRESFLDQVSIPEGESGGYKIRHFSRPAGKIETSNLRTALMGGQSDKPVVYSSATTWHELSYKHGVWMTDLPIEQAQHRTALAPMECDVLVGGLGLGLAANWLAQRPEVDSVTVIEKSKHVVKLVGPHVRDPRGIVKIVTADLFDYMKDRTVGPFLWAFFDIWQSDGESTFFKTVVPLRKLASKIRFLSDERVVCWNENVMRGQLVMGLHQRWAAIRMAYKGAPSLAEFAHPKDRSFWLRWSAPFFKAVEAGKITDKNFGDRASEYAGTYGRPGFEKWWREVT